MLCSKVALPKKSKNSAIQLKLASSSSKNPVKSFVLGIFLNSEFLFFFRSSFFHFLLKCHFLRKFRKVRCFVDVVIVVVLAVIVVVIVIDDDVNDDPGDIEENNREANGQNDHMSSCHKKNIILYFSLARQLSLKFKCRDLLKKWQILVTW